MRERSVLSAHLSLVEKSQERLSKQLLEKEEEVKRKDCQIASLQEQVRDRDTKLLELKVKIAEMEDVHERKIKMKEKKISALESEITCIGAYTMEMEEKDRQIKQLRKISSCNDHSLQCLKSENAELKKKAA